MRILMVLAAVASLCGAAMPAGAAESLLVGRVEAITLLPAGAPACPPACPPATVAADGSTRVCVSNGGGCQRTAFRIERVLLGDERPGLSEFAARIGEWGRLHFPVGHDPVLVHIDGEHVRWSRLSACGDDSCFEAAPFGQDRIGGVAVSTLARDAEGRVALGRLLERLRSAH